MSGKAKKRDLTAEGIIEVLERDRPKSLTALARGLGYSGSVSNWLRNKLLELVPDLAERIEANKGAGVQAEASAGPAAKPKKASDAKPPKKASGTEYPRHESNRFREGSSYATAYDVLAAAGDKGTTRADLVKEVARLTGKPEKNAYYDCVVVLSPRKTGEAHRSADKAADSYWVEKEPGGKVTLRLRKA